MSDYQVTLKRMSAPLVPSPLDYVGRREFSFYPPIGDAASNAWLLGTGSWSEVQVINVETGLELWIPRQYIGGVSDGSEMRLVVELTKELEHSGAVVIPRVKRVIEIRRAPDFHDRYTKKRLRFAGPAPVVGIRVEDENIPSSRFGKLALAAVAFSLLAALILAIARL